MLFNNNVSIVSEVGGCCRQTTKGISVRLGKGWGLLKALSILLVTHMKEKSITEGSSSLREKLKPKKVSSIRPVM